MSLSKIIRSSIRRLRSVLVLIVTVSLLFYYTFENELDMLNSKAENEYTPSINAGSRFEGKAGISDARGDTSNEITELAATDLKVLHEKNKYFPLLVSEPSKDPSKLLETFNDLDLNALATHKEKYPVLNEASLPVNSPDGPEFRIQSDHFEDDGLEDPEMLSKIRELFVNSWSQQELIDKVSEYDWPLSLIDSLDSLYIMGQIEKFDSAVKVIYNIDFTLPPFSVEIIDVPDVGSRALGGLLSAYELSMNTELLEKATEVADFLLRAFDTPNRVPVLQYFWKSKLNNKFPYKNSDVGRLTSMTLEFIRLSQLTRKNKYYDAAQRVYRTIMSSLDEFDLSHLFPVQLDASGCSLISSDKVQLGKHLTDLNGMKSIDENLQLIHCQQTGKLVSLNDDGIRSEQLFNMDASSQSTFSNLVKSYQLLKGNDILQVTDDQHSTKGDRASSVDDKSTKSQDILTKAADVQDLHSSKQVFVKAMDSVRGFMAFCPSTPLNENITMISSLRTKRRASPATNELHIEVTRHYDMKFERCSLASTLVLGSRVFGRPDYINFASNLTSGCFQLMELFGGLQPSELYMDPCENSDCSFDSQLKIQRANDGFYYNLESSRSEVVHQDDIAITNGKNTNGARQTVVAFAVKEGPAIYEVGDLEVEVQSKQWKHDPQRPLWLNKMGPMRLLAPSAIESVLYLYRMTGDSKWRTMGREMFRTTVDNLQNLNGGAKGVWKVSELHDNGRSLASSVWLSQTLKYFYLLFSDSSYLPFDEYVFTAGGHLLSSTGGENHL
ncbi:hypothetical protein HG536_0B06630 [Torulaspora globosa]|uniref:alpha-1,2-Mannosidase n=1 Tax=Torulaspora globosa TaxID=48254 RepID=A0A7G3ZE59_9SACH|nr:uncharacterized protein HG536_0B06630 [Torulaspora globosa]QLL31795.1 hypothetical protein HG536_0B06630 [Torulaspora globosa]